MDATGEVVCEELLLLSSTRDAEPAKPEAKSGGDGKLPLDLGNM